MTDTINPIGRPTKMTDEVVGKLESAFKDGATITEACRIAQIDRTIYYDWLKADKTFSNKMTSAQEYPDAIAKMLIVDAIKNKDVDTAKWWAERRMRNEFSTKSEQQHSGEIKYTPIMGGSANVSKDESLRQTPNTN